MRETLKIIRQEISTLFIDSKDKVKRKERKETKPNFNLIGESTKVNWENEFDEIIETNKNEKLGQIYNEFKE